MKRYMRLNGEMIEADSGTWVRYEDAAALATQAQRDYALAEEWKATAEGYRAESVERHATNLNLCDQVKDLRADADRLRVDLYNLGVECERLRAELAGERAAKLEWERLRNDAYRSYRDTADKLAAANAEVERLRAELDAYRNDMAGRHAAANAGTQHTNLIHPAQQLVLDAQARERTAAEQRVLDAMAAVSNKRVRDLSEGWSVLHSTIMAVFEAELARREFAK